MNSEDEFFDRLAAGLLIRKRIAPSGDLLGYKVALPDDRNGEKEPLFYAGSTLAPDLSLPRIRERWMLPAKAASADGLTIREAKPASVKRAATADLVDQWTVNRQPGEVVPGRAELGGAAHLDAAGLPDARGRALGRRQEDPRGPLSPLGDLVLRLDQVRPTSPRPPAT